LLEADNALSQGTWHHDPIDGAASVALERLVLEISEE
jgi:hypothetical protein